MKNKNTLLLLGIGIAYLIYKMYANKSIVTDRIKTPVMPPNDTNRNPIDPLPPIDAYKSPNLISQNFDDVIRVTSIPNQFLVDKVNSPAEKYNPDYYQTYYGALNGNGYKVPSTC
jgi:hypothetical protein